tara:strand:- start:42 stop:395 length:354 start_codon:yes stop_codon:yes gene_type:complete
MKQLVLLLITLTTLTNVSYASFPITKNNTCEVLSATNIQDHADNEPSLLVYILRGILFVSVLGFASYFLIRAWWRAWRDEVKWVRVSTYIVFGFLALILLLGGICGIVEGGCIYNMQ